MPRKPQEVPSLKLHKASGRYYIIIAGERVYLGKDPDRANELRRRLLAEQLLHGEKPAAQSATGDGWRTVAEVLAACGVEAERVYSLGQLGRVRQAFLAASSLYGSSPANRFGPVELDAVRSSLLTQTDKRSKRGLKLLSRNYVNSLIGVVQTWWTWAATKGLVPPEKAVTLTLVDKLKKGRGGKEMPRVRAVSLETVTATLPFCNGAVAAMARLQQVTGMRPGEVCRMRRDWISTTRKERLVTTDGVTVSALEVDGVPIWVYVPGTHKGSYADLPKIVALGPKAQEILQPFFDRPPDAYLFSPIETERERLAKMRARRKTPVQPSQQTRARPRRSRPLGSRYTPGGYRKSILHAIARAARAGETIPHWFPNSLRHYAGTEISCAMDQHFAQAALGHTTPDTTATYIDGLLRKAAAVAARMG